MTYCVFRDGKKLACFDGLSDAEKYFEKAIADENAIGKKNIVVFVLRQGETGGDYKRVSVSFSGKYCVFRDNIKLECFEGLSDAEKCFKQAISDEKAIKGKKNITVVFHLRQGETGGNIETESVSC